MVTIILAIIPIACFLVMVLMQILFTRQNPELSPWVVFFRCFLAMFLIVLYLTYYAAIMSGCSHRDVIGYILINVFSYASLSFCYFNFINLIYTSLRIRCLKEIYLNKGAMSEDEILKIYNSDFILEQRLLRLVKVKNLSFELGNYTLGENDSLNTLGSILGFFKKILLKRAL